MPFLFILNLLKIHLTFTSNSYASSNLYFLDGFFVYLFTSHAASVKGSKNDTKCPKMQETCVISNNLFNKVPNNHDFFSTELTLSVFTRP